MIETSSKQNTRKTHMILDTSYFIKLKPLNLLEGWKYYTTDYIVKEIRDEKAREFYNLNKDFIQIKTPTKESFIKVSQFAKQSNDLANLSLPDLSIISLAYEIINQEGLGESIRKEPMNYEVVMKETKQKKEEKEEVVWEDEGEWITSENIDKKINEKLKVTQEDPLEKEVNVYICSADFTVQNLSLKMGIPVMGIDGYRIKKIKNYIYKCYTCNTFIFDTTRKFCDFCGYPTLMKIGYNVSQTGKIKINDKKPDSRLRGTQVLIKF